MECTERGNYWNSLLQSCDIMSNLSLRKYVLVTVPWKGDYYYLNSVTSFSSLTLSKELNKKNCSISYWKYWTHIVLCRTSWGGAMCGSSISFIRKCLSQYAVFLPRSGPCFNLSECSFCPIFYWIIRWIHCIDLDTLNKKYSNVNLIITYRPCFSRIHLHSKWERAKTQKQVLYLPSPGLVA